MYTSFFYFQFLACPTYYFLPELVMEGRYIVVRKAFREYPIPTLEEARTG